MGRAVRAQVWGSRRGKGGGGPSGHRSGIQGEARVWEAIGAQVWGLRRGEDGGLSGHRSGV